MESHHIDDGIISEVGVAPTQDGLQRLHYATFSRRTSSMESTAPLLEQHPMYLNHWATCPTRDVHKRDKA
jgi:hypothetical protein